MKLIPKDTLIKSEREALNNLQQKDDIIITKVGKGDAVAKMDVILAIIKRIDPT